VIPAKQISIATENWTRLGTFFTRHKCPYLPRAFGKSGFALAAVPNHRYANDYENEEYNGDYGYPTSTLDEAINPLNLARRRPPASFPAPLLHKSELSQHEGRLAAANPTDDERLPARSVEEIAKSVSR
jgi:hypothetical protein